jgi:hypothetical protein
MLILGLLGGMAIGLGIGFLMGVRYGMWGSLY